MTDPDTTSKLPAGADDLVEAVRSEERLSITTPWVPYRHARIGKRVVTETRTVTFDVRREEFFYEDQALTDSDTTTAGAGSLDGLELTLYEERVVVDRVVVPVERIRVRVERVGAAVDISAPLAREHLTLEETAATAEPTP